MDGSRIGGRAYIFLFLACAECGARTALESSVSLATGGFGGSGPVDSGVDAAAVCTPVVPSRAPPCSSWLATADGTMITEPPPPNSAIDISDVLANGCDVLVAWYTTTASRPRGLAWSTRVLAFDGSPRTEVQTHPALAAVTESGGEMSLATNRANIAGLVTDETGCRFVPLAANGADAGDTVREGPNRCLGLAAESDGFSYLTTSTQGGTPVDLVRVDARGAVRDRTTLVVPAKRAAWARFNFEDGSFVVNTFREDPQTGNYTDWLQHFAAQGAPLAPERDVGANTAPVQVASTATGLLAAWSWSSVDLAPLTRNGVMAGALQSVPLAGPLYGLSLVSVPNGDAMLFWTENTRANDFNLFVQAIAPDGTPRAPARLFRTTRSTSVVRVVVAPEGDRALVVLEGGLAVPLKCVR